jgi:hypothetical protein
LDDNNLYIINLQSFGNGLEEVPVWGQIVNEQPEWELEELKAEERRREEEQRELQRVNQPLKLEDQFHRYLYDVSPPHQEKRDSSLMPKHFKQNQLLNQQQQQHSSVAPNGAEGLTTAAATTTAVPTTIAASLTSRAATSTEVHHVQPGQKEIPMLRPPSMSKATMDVHHEEDESEDEPVIQVAQRSSAGEKPSAYDTLRKYLSLEDALKKVREGSIWS